MKKLYFLLILPILGFSQIDNYNMSKIDTYYLKLSKIHSNIYKIHGTNYYIKTRKCEQDGYSREVKLTILDNKDNTVCFLNKKNEEMGVVFNESYTDCYSIIKIYKSIDVQKMIQLESTGFKKAELILKETVLNPDILNE
tara:strand:+ start:30 stop:449 length:420 start_codon:yes stop_codon:yes gene_type:complete